MRMRVLLGALLLLAAVSVVVAGCGGGSSSSSSSSTASASAAGAEGETGSGGGSEAGGESATASSVDCSSVEEPTKLSWEGPTEPVKPPSGDNLVVLIPTALELEAAGRPVEGMEEALQALGWKTQVLDGEFTPSVYNKNIQQAINLHAAAIITDGVDPELVKNSLADARSHGIVVISDAETGDPEVSPTPPSSGYEADVSPDEKAMGELMGTEIACASNQEAHLLAMQDAEYASVGLFINSAVEKVEACSTCSVEEVVETQASEVQSQIPSETVNDIRTNPEIDSVLTGFDPVTVFQVPALKAAGLLEDVKLYSEYGDSQNLEFIRNGEQEATVAVPYEWSGWAAVDEMLRAMNKQPLVNENIPFALITKEVNLPPAGEPFTGKEVDFAGEYKKLWGLG
jgi:ribose transport system substrate-binding protein